MKKIVSAVLFMCLVVSSFAQDRKNGVSVGWAYYPVALVDHPFGSEPKESSSSGKGDGYLPANTAGLFSLEYSRVLNGKRTISVCASSISWNKQEKPVSWLFVSAYIRYNYVQKEIWRLYSGAGLGLGVSLVYNDGPAIAPILQFLPIGVSVGRRFRGFFETGIGIEYNGFRAGIGYSF